MKNSLIPELFLPILIMKNKNLYYFTITLIQLMNYVTEFAFRIQTLISDAEDVLFESYKLETVKVRQCYVLK